jgi:hypothetical protein
MTIYCFFSLPSPEFVILVFIHYVLLCCFYWRPRASGEKGNTLTERQEGGCGGGSTNGSCMERAEGEEACRCVRVCTHIHADRQAGVYMHSNKQFCGYRQASTCIQTNSFVDTGSQHPSSLDSDDSGGDLRGWAPISSSGSWPSGMSCTSLVAQH